MNNTSRCAVNIFFINHINRRIILNVAIPDSFVKGLVVTNYGFEKY